jgi:hypothetical protein
MKRAILDRQKEILARQIEERGLIKKCEKVSWLGKYTQLKERNSSTHSRWDYSQGGISISSESGMFVMSGFELIVESGGQEVFHVVDGSIYSSKKFRKPFIPVRRENPAFSDTRVIAYSPGDWEQKLEEALQDVPNNEVDKYREQFGMRF